MNANWNLPLIVERFAESAQGENNWQSVLDFVSEEVGAQGATIIPLQDSFPHFPASQSFGEAMERYVNDGWITRDVRFSVAELMKRRGIATDLDFITEEKMKRHPYYQEWLQPFGLQWFAAIHINMPQQQFSLSIQRTPEQGPFDPAEIAKLQLLSAGLTNAMSIGTALDHRGIEAALGAFDLSNKAVLVLNRVGDVVAFNRAADALFDDNFDVRQRRIFCRDHQVAQQLEMAIGRTCREDVLSDFLAPVSIPRCGNLPMIAHVSRARGLVRDVFSTAQVFVILHDPAQRKSPSVDLLQKIFSLTPSEARIAFRLAQGDKLQAIAHANGVSYETARSQLKSIFSKVGVTSQADLAAFLLGLYVG